MTSNIQVENDVLLGKEGYLFLWKGGQKQFDFLKSELSPNVSSLINFEKNIRKRIEICNSRNICYRHIVFPSKPVVKSSYIPKEVGDIQSLFNRCYSNLLSDLINNYIIYPLDELCMEEVVHSTFYKTDTHMTAKGNITVANLLISSIGLTPQNYPNISFKVTSHKGDLSNMIGGDKVSEELPISNPPSSFMVGNRDYLNGNTNDVQIFHSSHDNAHRRLLVFGDSFFKDLLPFLLPFFKEIFYIRSEFFHEDIVELYQPDYVFSGNAERYLASIRSDEQSNNFIMDLYGDTSFSPNIEYKKAFKSCLSYKYHNNIYFSWAKSLLSSIYTKLDLEKATLSHNLTSSNNGHFKSMGNDPYLHFMHLRFKSCFYAMRIEIESSVESILQVYFTDLRDEKLLYTEKNSTKVKIKIGFNHLRVSLNSYFLGANIRIDPIEGVGHFFIKSVILSQEA